MDNKTMITSKKQRLQDNNTGFDTTHNPLVVGSNPTEPNIQPLANKQLAGGLYFPLLFLIVGLVLYLSFSELDQKLPVELRRIIVKMRQGVSTEIAKFSNSKMLKSWCFNGAPLECFEWVLANLGSAQRRCSF